MLFMVTSFTCLTSNGSKHYWLGLSCTYTLFCRFMKTLISQYFVKYARNFL